MTLTKIKDMDKTYSFKKYPPKIVGEDCLCGITFQHIHKDGEGYKNPIGVVDAVEMGLLDKSDNPKEQEWENYNWEIKLTILYIKNKGIMDLTELKPFIRQLIKEAKDDGITEGLNLTRMTFEANREAWEKEARESALDSLRETVDKPPKYDFSKNGVDGEYYIKRNEVLEKLTPIKKLEADNKEIIEAQEEGFKQGYDEGLKAQADKYQLIEEIEGMKITYSQAEGLVKNCLTDKNGYCKFGYNQAIDEVVTLLKT